MSSEEWTSLVLALPAAAGTKAPPVVALACAACFLGLAVTSLRYHRNGGDARYDLQGTFMLWGGALVASLALTSPLAIPAVGAALSVPYALAVHLHPNPRYFVHLSVTGALAALGLLIVAWPTALIPIGIFAGGIAVLSYPDLALSGWRHDVWHCAGAVSGALALSLVL